MSSADNNLYKFDNFRLDTTERSLWRGDELVPLPPKVLDVLFLLVEKNGGIVSKKELMDAVWADAFVEESNLTQNIYTLRRTLGKNETGQDFIETVPRRGYRFAVPVKFVAQDNKPKSPVSNFIIENKAVPDVDITQDVPAADKQNFLIASSNTEKETVSAVPETKYRWALFGIIAVIAAGLISVSFYPFRIQNSKAIQSPIENVSIKKLTSTGDSAYHAISPDGKSIAYTRLESLYVQDIESEKSVKLNIPNANIFGFIQFSGDGETLYYRNQYRVITPGTVFRVSRFGGEAMPVLENVWSAFSFSPDEKSAAFIRFDPAANEHKLMLKNLDSGEERILLTRKLPDSFNNKACPAWSADGKLLAVTTRSPKSVGQIVILDVINGTTQVIEPSRAIGVSHVAWMPDGKSLIASARENQKTQQLWRISFPDGVMNRLTNDLNRYGNVSLSADGKRLVSNQYTAFSHIWVADAGNLDNQKQITFGNLNLDGGNGIAWTPDGNIVYSTFMGDHDIWTVNPNDGSRQRLTQNAGVANVNPVVTRDGKYIYFNSTRNRGSHIWRMNINGENPEQLTFSDTDTEYFPNISPDGNWLYYVQRSPTKSSAVWRKSLADGATERLTIPEIVSPNSFLFLSPDGKYLAFQNLTAKVEEEDGTQMLQIGVISTEGINEPRFYNIPASHPVVRWASDSKSFDYLEHPREKGAKLWRQSLDSGTPPKLLLHLPKYGIGNFAWSADGKQIGFGRNQGQNDAVLLTNFQP